MNRLMMTVGFLAGLVAAGTCGILVGSGKWQPHKLMRKTADAMDDMMDDVARCVKRHKHHCY